MDPPPPLSPPPVPVRVCVRDGELGCEVRRGWGLLVRSPRCVDDVERAPDDLADDARLVDPLLLCLVVDAATCFVGVRHSPPEETAGVGHAATSGVSVDVVRLVSGWVLPVSPA